MMTSCPCLSVATPPQNHLILSSQPPRLSLNNRFLVHPRLRCQYTRNSSFGGETRGNFCRKRDTGGGDNHDTSPFWYKGQRYEYVVVENNVITPLDQYIKARSPPPSDSSVVCSNPSFLSILNQVGMISKPSWALEVMIGCFISWLFKDD